MPSEPRAVCQIASVRMQSTGQGGPEVNRDLEVLFDTLNQVIRCVGKLRDFANTTSLGGFASGESGAASQTTQQQTGTSAGRSFSYYTSGSNFSLPDGFDGVAYVEATAALELTLPKPTPGQIIFVVNANATHAITVKNESGVTIGVVAAGGFTECVPHSDAGGVWVWPDGVIVVGPDGVIAAASIPTTSAAFEVQEAGVQVVSSQDAGLFSALNFVSGATIIEGDPGVADITITSGAPSATTVEVDIGSTPKTNGKFTITDASISGTSKILCWQAPGPYTGKGTRADEAEMQPVSVIAVEPGTGTAVVKWETPPMTVVVNQQGRLAPNFGGGTAANSGTNRAVQTNTQRIGKVRGNVKFTYMILA